MKSILCTECKKQISNKKDLAVTGKLMQPYHKECLEKPISRIGKVHKFYGKFPVGIRFWFFIILGNTFLYEILKRYPESLSVIIFFWIIFNIVFIGGRVGIYLSYEQYLK